MRRYFGGTLGCRRFAIWGLSFKPCADDLRDAPSVRIIRALLDESCAVSAHDPWALDSARRIFGGSLECHQDAYEALDGADGLVVCTEWPEFRNPDFLRIAGLLKTPVIFDGRNLYDPERVIESGLDYLCIGRPDRLLNRASCQRAR